MFTAMAIASVTDVRTGLIPNALTFPLMLIGIALTGKAGLIGFGVATLIHYSLWLLGVEKGGDAKLLMGHGACMGWHANVEASLWYAAVYLPAGIAFMTLWGRWGNFGAILRFRLYDALDRAPEGMRDQVQGAMAMLRVNPGERPEEEPEPTELRTAPIIAIAALGAYFTDWLDLLT